MLLSLKDYERIFRIVHAVSCAVGNTPGKSCLFYNVIGAYLIKRNFNINALPVMGAWFVNVDAATDTKLMSSKIVDGIPTSDSEAFHCWIQTRDYIIDLTSPVYAESLLTVGKEVSLQRKMFQKLKVQQAHSHIELYNEGDFFCLPNTDLSEELLARFFESDEAKDLAEVCNRWFKKSPKKIDPRMTMMSNLGEVYDVVLAKHRVAGKW